MTDLEEELDLDWDPLALDLILDDLEEDVTSVQGLEALEKSVVRSIRSSKYTFQLINCHQRDVPRLLNNLEEELENKESLLKLGKINLEFDIQSKKLKVEAPVESQEPKTITQVINLLEL